MESKGVVVEMLSLFVQYLSWICNFDCAEYSKSIHSKEGIIQGDPLSVMFYAIAVLALIRALVHRENWSQN